MGANESSYGRARGGYASQQAVVPYQSQQQQTVVPYQSQQQQTSYGAQYSQGVASGGSGSGGPLGGNNPNMVWDEARGGYWIRETVADGSDSSDYGSGGAYTAYNGQPGKVIRRTTTCCEPEPNIIVHNHKKVIHYDSDSDDEITIITPPPQPPVIVNCPPPQTNVFILPCQPCPEKPKPCSGPSTFFPEVRERSFKMETQVKQSGCMTGGCGGAVISCGPCGGRAGPSCSRCSSYH